MTKGVTFDFSFAEKFITQDNLDCMKEKAISAKEVLLQRSGDGNEFLGWLDVPVSYDKEEFNRIKKAAKRIQDSSEVLIVIGIGGSYLGARAAIEYLRHTFYNCVSREIRKAPQIYYLGNNLSEIYHSEIFDVIGDRDVSVNVISKSGTTTEPAIAFRHRGIRRKGTGD